MVGEFANAPTRIVYEMIGVWSYWILGTYDSHSDTLSLTSGILRSCESLGSTFSYAVGSSKNASLLVNLLVAAVVFWVSVPASTWAAWVVPDVPAGEGDDERLTDESSDSAVEGVRVQTKSGDTVV